MKTREDVNMPRRSTIGSCGYDFYAPETFELRPGEWTMIDTGVSLDDDDMVSITKLSRVDEYVNNAIAYMADWFMMLVPRSGLSNKCGFRLRNTVGIIDKDYRNTIKALVTVDEPYTLQKGERFMQGILLPFGTFWDECEPIATRSGGHGSTGRF